MMKVLVIPQEYQIILLEKNPHSKPEHRVTMSDESDIEFALFQ